MQQKNKLRAADDADLDGERESPGRWVDIACLFFKHKKNKVRLFATPSSRLRKIRVIRGPQFVVLAGAYASTSRTTESSTATDQLPSAGSISPMRRGRE